MQLSKIFYIDAFKRYEARDVIENNLRSTHKVYSSVGVDRLPSLSFWTNWVCLLCFARYSRPKNLGEACHNGCMEEVSLFQICLCGALLAKRIFRRSFNYHYLIIFIYFSHVLWLLVFRIILQCIGYELDAFYLL